VTLDAAPLGNPHLSALNITTSGAAISTAITVNQPVIVPAGVSARIGSWTVGSGGVASGTFNQGGILAGPLTINAGATAILFLNDTGNGNGFTMTGVITGSGELSRGGPAILTDSNGGVQRDRGTIFINPFTNSSATFFGPISVYRAAILNVASDPSMGSATGGNANVKLDQGGTLQMGASFTNTRNLVVGMTNAKNGATAVNPAGGVLDTQGFNNTFGDVSVMTGQTGGQLSKNGSGTLTLGRINTARIPAAPMTLAVTAGTVVIAPNQPLPSSSIENLQLSINTKLDLTNNLFITKNAAGSLVGSTYTGVQGLVAQGKGTSNTWNGATGIVTSQTQAIGSNLTSIGVAQASDVRANTVSETALWGGQTITGTDTLVMYTYGGDATLDGRINIDDYIRIDNGIAGNLTGWSNGDFNYDGKINIDDYTTVIDANIGNQTLGTFPTAGGISEANGVTAVPEPAAVSMLALTAALKLLRRRRGKRSL
jgi:hypothetical protein